MKKFLLTVVIIFGSFVTLIGILFVFSSDFDVTTLVVAILFLAVGGSMLFFPLRSFSRTKKRIAAEIAAETAERIASQERERQERIQKSIRLRQSKIDAFNAELNAIPLEAIIPNLQTPKIRQYLKSMPEYPYKTITKRTPLMKLFPLVFLDVETTGLATSSGRIVEVSAIYFDDGFEPTRAFTTLINPQIPIPEDAIEIHGITDEMVKDAPTFAQIREQLEQFISGCNIFGHNLEFDVRFLYTAGMQLPLNVKYYDMLPFAQKVLKRGTDIENHKLVTLCDHYGIERDSAHRSLSDCLAESKVFEKLWEEWE